MNGYETNEGLQLAAAQREKSRELDSCNERLAAAWREDSTSELVAALTAQSAALFAECQALADQRLAANTVMVTAEGWQSPHELARERGSS